MGKEQKQISDAYRSLFGLSPTTTQNEEKSPEDEYSRLIKRITDCKQHHQELKDKRTSILAETPEFRKILKTYEDFIRNPQYQYARLLKGCQTYSLTQEDKERVLFTSAPDRELRIAHKFSRSPAGLRAGICVADRPNPSYVYWIPISQGEHDAVEEFRKIDWKIVCVEGEISSLEVELRGCRVRAIVAGIPLPAEPPEAAPSESADEQPLAEVSASEKIAERSIDHEAGEEAAGTKRSVKEPGRKPDAESMSAPVATNESAALSSSPQDGEGDSQQNAPIVHFSKTKKGWRIDYGSNKIILDRHYAGGDCYRVLVTQPDRTMSALEVEVLAGGTSDDQPARSRELLDGLSDLGDLSYDPKVDKTALREVEDRRDHLKERLESTTNPEESSSILEELNDVEKYIRLSTRQSKSGKVLKALNNKTPLRKAARRVRRNIGTFLEQIEQYDKKLSIDLNRGLSLGDDCSFTPDPHRPIDFRFD